jgi:hypothetical protein
MNDATGPDPFSEAPAPVGFGGLGATDEIGDGAPAPALADTQALAAAGAAPAPALVPAGVAGTTAAMDGPTPMALDNIDGVTARAAAPGPVALASLETGTTQATAQGDAPQPRADLALGEDQAAGARGSLLEQQTTSAPEPMALERLTALTGGA